MIVAICIVCRETLESGQSSNPIVGGGEDGNRDQRRREYEGKICTLSCGHVMHVQCVYLWWKTITEQVRFHEHVSGIGDHLIATGASGNSSTGRYPCPMCGTLQEKPVSCEIFLTFDTGSGGGNDSGKKQELKRQIEELTAKNEKLSNHYAELCRQD